MTKARDIADFKFENIVDIGTEGTKLAVGTTAQRGSTQGQFRFNTTTGLAEYYDGSNFKSIDSPIDPLIENTKSMYSNIYKLSSPVFPNFVKLQRQSYIDS